MKPEHHEIVALAKRYNRPNMIAAWLGIPVQTVHNVLHKARKTDGSIPYFDNRHQDITPVLPGQIVVGIRLMPLLEKEAKRRGQSVQVTARDILEQGLLAGVSRHD